MGIFRKKPYIAGLAELKEFEQKDTGPGVGYISVTCRVFSDHQSVEAGLMG
jgi:hypothetical protein